MTSSTPIDESLRADRLKLEAWCKAWPHYACNETVVGGVLMLFVENARLQSELLRKTRALEETTAELKAAVQLTLGEQIALRPPEIKSMQGVIERARTALLPEGEGGEDSSSASLQSDRVEPHGDPCPINDRAEGQP